MVAVVAQVLHPEPADGPDPGAGVDQRPEDRPVPKPVHVAGFDGGEETARLVDTHLGRAALPERMAHPPDRLKRIQDRRVPGHQGIEEVAQSGQGLVLGGGGHRGARPGTGRPNPGVTWCSSSPSFSHQVRNRLTWWA